MSGGGYKRIWNMGGRPRMRRSTLGWGDEGSLEEKKWMDKWEDEPW